jgi:hypothetical protein
LKTCFQDIIPDEGLLLNMIDESLKIVKEIDEKIIISKNSLYNQLNKPKNLVNYLIESLINKGHVEVK